MPNFDNTVKYYKLPDRSPYLYFRTPSGQRLLFPKAEIHAVNQIGARILVTSIFGHEYTVTSRYPEVVSGTSLEQAFYKGN